MQFNEILSNEMNLRYEMEVFSEMHWNWIKRNEVKWGKYKWNEVEYDGMIWNKEDWYGIRENGIA